MHTTWLELTAVRVLSQDSDPAEALDRVQDLEGEPIDDTTWSAMVALARMSLGGDPEIHVEEDRRWGSAKVASGPFVVDVLWQGNAANIWYTTGEADDEFYKLLERLREAGLTIVQGYGVAEVPPNTTVAEMVSAQEQGL